MDKQIIDYINNIKNIDNTTKITTSELKNFENTKNEIMKSLDIIKQSIDNPTIDTTITCNDELFNDLCNDYDKLKNDLYDDNTDFDLLLETYNKLSNIEYLLESYIKNNEFEIINL